MKAKNWSQQNDDEKAALGRQPPRPAATGDAPPSEASRKLGQQRDESGESGQQRAEQRLPRPGAAGLANENRPGLGTRADPTSNRQEYQGHGGSAAPGGKPASDEPDRAAAQAAQSTERPAPREQRSDSLAQEEQRSTGMSGQSGGV